MRGCKIHFKEIKELNNCEDVKILYEESFPPEEKVNFYDFFSGVFSNFQLYALYKAKALVGIFHFKDAKNFVHLNYLAVKSKYQNQGFGSKIISWLKKEFKNKSIVVDIEELDNSAANFENRIRRKRFYKKNGFVDGKHTFDWEGTFMTYMHYGPIDDEEFMNYIQKVFPTIKNIREK